MGYGHLLFQLVSAVLCGLAFSSILAPHLCPKHQSLALVKLRQTFSVDPFFYAGSCGPYRKTITWNTSTDCCLWDGVKCDEFTGHVIELDLSCSGLAVKIDSNSTLFQLSHLQRLNLSWNSFFPSHISPKFGMFSNLTHLDLSHTDFRGQIPSEISHLSKLQSLRLSHYEGALSLTAHGFEMLLQNLTQLRELDLTFVNISSTLPRNFSSHLTRVGLRKTGLRGILPESIFHLGNLQVLDLHENDQLSGYFPKTKWNSSASLRELDLSPSTFSGDLPESLGYLTSLQSLTLDSCNLSGPIPTSLWNLTRIESLDLQNNHLEGVIPLFTNGLQNVKSIALSGNSLNGEIPSWIFSIPSLSELGLSNNLFSGQLKDFKFNTLELVRLGHNRLQGSIPKSLQNLVSLEALDLSSNNFSGNVDVSIFSNLKQLWYLDLSHNSIRLTNENKVKSTLPEFLKQVALSGCEVKELDFLRSAKHLDFLDLSNNKIQGTIPDWAWSNLNTLSTLNLSHNMLTSIDPISSLPPNAWSIDLRSNTLQGLLPFPPPRLRFFFISNNYLTGEISPSFCNVTYLRVLDLASNNLEGSIPQCLGSLSNLEVLDMQHNSLSGKLFMNFSFGSALKSFNLHGNKLEGKIPRSLADCKQLDVLDLGDNHLNDTFPMWLGTLPKLQVLSLRSNKLHGPIRTYRIGKLFPQLRILDLSCNAFTAELPTSLFRNLNAMRRIDQTIKVPSDEVDKYYQDSVVVVTKGLELKVVRILSLYTTIDLSNNKFEGRICSDLGDLTGLRVLNLSHNGLQGHIPPSLGELSVVESLDLSFNKLSGEIPKQLASLTYLEFINFSHNHLTGCIPQGNQFHTFENNSYEGNDGLRGFPVSNGCGSSWRPETNKTTFDDLDQESNSTFLSEFSWKVVLLGYGSGLIIGFSVAYVLLSARNPNWLSWIAEELEYMIITRMQKRQRNQRRYRRNNVV